MASMALLVAPVHANTAKYGSYDLISQNNLRAHLSFIASDLLEGRDTPSRGLDIAAEYIATQMKLYGAEPAGENGTYFQTMVWGRDVLHAEGTTAAIGDRQLQLGTDFVPSSLAKVDLDHPVVFVSSGWVNKEKGIDPFAGIDVRNKVVITDGQAPQVPRQELLSEWTSVQVAAREAGAVAIVTLTPNANPSLWQRSVERMAAGGTSRPLSNQPSFPVISMTNDAAQTFFTAQISANNLKSDARLKLTLNVEQERHNAYNVVAVVPGTDPVLKNEYVALGAHYDHVGIGRPDETGDTIYNGADDNGSGTVALIEIARAMLKGERPKRSSLFIWFCGEEKGLHGSRFYTQNPTVPLNSIKWMANLDMVSMAKQPGDTNPRNASLANKGEIYVIGPKTISSTMDGIIRRVNGEVHNLNLNDKHDTLDDPERIFFRSDHINFARVGIPAIFFFSGAHQHYHRPSDEISVVDFEQYQMNVQTIFAVIFEMGNIADVPVIDKIIPGLNG